MSFFKPERPNWRHYFGGLSLVFLILQLVTGLILTAFYEPSLKDAYRSVQIITNEIPGGSLSRNLHRWIAFLVFGTVLIHTLRSTFRKDFSNPLKKVEWMTGVLLVWPLFLLLYTGLILPWEWKGYWFMEMMASYAATVPVMGPDLKAFFLMEFTLPRFWAVHILLLPAICLVLVDYHFLATLRKRGVFRHLSRHLWVSIPFIVIAVALSIYLTIPTKDPDEIPMPLEGEYIPAPEWYALLMLLPFKFFTGHIVPVLSVYIPFVLYAAIAFLPYFIKGRFGKAKVQAEPKPEEKGAAIEEGAFKSDAEVADGTEPLDGPSSLDDPEPKRPEKPAGKGRVFIRGAIITVIFAITFGLIYLGNFASPTLGCNSCHNLSRGTRMGVPPDTFRDRRTLPNLDDDKWMMGHWYYPNEIY